MSTEPKKQYIDHARLSPSGSKRWMACAGSISLEELYPDKPNDFSDSGTAMHTVASEVLGGTGLVALDWLNDKVKVSVRDEPTRTVDFDEDMVKMTQDYCDCVRDESEGALDGPHIEQRVEFSHYVGVPDQFGTIDAYWVSQGIPPHLRPEPSKNEPELNFPTQAMMNAIVLNICDLKSGFKWVGTDTPQLKFYALGVLREIELVWGEEITHVRLMIYAPRHGGLRDELISIAELLLFAEVAKQKAALVEHAANLFPVHWLKGSPHEKAGWERTFLNPTPNEEECAFCRAMPECPAQRALLEEIVDGAFEVVDERLPSGVLETTLVLRPPPEPRNALAPALADWMSYTGLLEDWIKSVRAEVERRLLAGEKVPGYGLELGRQGNRAWKDKEKAETMMRKQFRLKIEEAYDLKLISPTSAEKLVKQKLLTPIQWGKLQAEVVRSDAVPSVKPESRIKLPYSPPPVDDGDFDVVHEVKPPEPDPNEDLY